MLAEERRLKLAEWTQVDGRLDANDAASKLAVAVETVRRDLDVLQRRGVVRRVHGGAIALDRFTHEYTIPERLSQNLDLKKKVAAAAASFIPSEGCIFVDGGTTAAQMAEYLRDRPKLVVVTNSITLASKLADSSTQTVMLGGRIRPASLSAVGAKTVSDLMDLNADIAFLGANGVSFDGGVTAYDTDEAMVKRTMMANSLERILLVDSGKFGSSYPARFANFDSFDRVVTNFDAEQIYVDGFGDAGVEVALA
jgi:DeoR family transcriptional regulator, fructose operon transcriptional repressor